MSNQEIIKKSWRSKKEAKSLIIVRKGFEAVGRAYGKIALKIKSKEVAYSSKCK